MLATLSSRRNRPGIHSEKLFVLLFAPVLVLAMGISVSRTEQRDAAAWEVLRESEQTIVEKSGGLNNTSIYIGMEMQAALPADGIGSFAVVVHSDGHNLFFNHGYAEAGSKQLVDSDSLFNLASIGKVFDATLLAVMVQQRELDLQ
jgi:CubicO group peptidase (beta-lactamase class C family)